MRRSISIVWLLSLTVVLAVSCKKEEERSEEFSKIFRQDKDGTFRGVDLGMPLEKVKAIEGNAPKHDDQWGFVYEYGLGGKKRYFLEYICKDPKVRNVNSIVLNVFLDEKTVATHLFTEMEMYLRQRYGVADGALGNLRWSNDEANLLIALRMLDDKKSISLNYVPLQPL
jgi:hypothetical protein